VWNREDVKDTGLIQVLISLYLLCNISNPTMRTGLDFKSAQFDQVRSKAEDCEACNLVHAVRIGGFEMTSHANKSLFD
jgi:hypothetical protein